MSKNSKKSEQQLVPEEDEAVEKKEVRTCTIYIPHTHTGHNLYIPHTLYSVCDMYNVPITYIGVLCTLYISRSLVIILLVHVTYTGDYFFIST